MVTKYRTTGHLDIKRVEVLRETKSCVYIESTGTKKKFERRESKVNDFCAYFDTWEEARQHLLKKAEDELSTARARLQGWQSRVGNIKGMKKPVEAA